MFESDDSAVIDQVLPEKMSTVRLEETVYLIFGTFTHEGSTRNPYKEIIYIYRNWAHIFSYILQQEVTTTMYYEKFILKYHYIGFSSST